MKTARCTQFIPPPFVKQNTALRPDAEYSEFVIRARVNEVTIAIW